MLDRKVLDECIAIEINPMRIGFAGGADVWTRDVLNIGIRPDMLIEKVLCIERSKNN